MRTGAAVAAALLAAVLLGGMITGNLTQQVSDRYVAASQEILVMAEGGQWDRAAQTLAAYQETWQETLRWLQMLVHHDDTDDVTLAMLRLEAGIRGQDAGLCREACNELAENARHIYHRDALTWANVL